MSGAADGQVWADMFMWLNGRMTRLDCTTGLVTHMQRMGVIEALEEDHAQPKTAESAAPIWAPHSGLGPNAT